MGIRDRNTGVVIVKHAKPSGVSIQKNNLDSYRSAMACDTISDFGANVSCNFNVTTVLALELNNIFFDDAWR